MLQTTGQAGAPQIDPSWPFEPLPPDGAADSERAFITQLRRGDAEAYEDLVRRYSSRMSRTARQLLRDDDDVRDVVQEAFLCAFKGMRHFSGAAKLSTWLYRIVVNAALMKLRHRRRRPEQPCANPENENDTFQTEAPCSRAMPADAAVERQQARAIVRECIDRLPASHRKVLLLRDIEELDTDEVADHLGIANNAVRVRVHRARQALRGLLERRLAAA